jgi:DNA-binding LacI/PurR family transcriptional regulator
LLAQGWKIPEDISVVGFGNILTAEFYRVPLTTIRQPKFRMGVAAMETMMNMIRGAKAKTQRLGAELVARQSTAPPKIQ